MPTPPLCSTQRSRVRSMRACAAESSRKPAGTRSRCSNCRMTWMRRSSPSESAPSTPSRSPGVSSGDSSDASTQLPAATRQLMLIAAADPSGDVTLLWRAATRVGIPVDAVVPAQESGLLELGAQVRFRHPLMRSAIYRAATGEDRRKAHEVLAESMIGDADSDYLAWHRAEAADGLDEASPPSSRASAVRAQARGGWAAAAAFLTRSMELTPDPGRRAPTGARRRARPPAGWSHRRGARHARRSPRSDRSATSMTRARNCSELRSRSRPPAAGRLRRCCFSRRSGSSRWMPRWHGRRISMRSPPPSSPGASRTAVARSTTWRRRSSTRTGAKRGHRFPPPANCCSTDSRRSSKTATPPGSRCSAAHSSRYGPSEFDDEDALAVALAGVPGGTGGRRRRQLARAHGSTCPTRATGRSARHVAHRPHRAVHRRAVHRGSRRRARAGRRGGSRDDGHGHRSESAHRVPASRLERQRDRSSRADRRQPQRRLGAR